MKNVLTLKDLNRAQFSLRFHTVNHTHSQSIADHACVTAVYSQYIADQILKLPAQDELDMMNVALNHGIDKLVTGDAPANYTSYLKSLHPQLASEQKKVIDELLPEIAGIRGKIEGKATEIVVNAAKLLDAYQYIKLTGTVDREQQEVVLKNLDTLFEINGNQAQKRHPEIDWSPLKQVRHDILFGKSGLLEMEINRLSGDNSPISNGLTIRDVSRTQFVTRWHTVLTTKTQSLASHSFIVGRLAQDMAKKLQPNLPASEEINLLNYALAHDNDELVSGDQNGSFRAYMRKHNPQMMEAQEKLLDSLCPDVAKLRSKVHDTPSKYLVKAADLIDASSYILLTGVEPETRTVIAENLDEYFQINLDSAKKSFPDLDWSVVEQVKEDFIYGKSGLLEMEMNRIADIAHLHDQEDENENSMSMY